MNDSIDRPTRLRSDFQKIHSKKAVLKAGVGDNFRTTLKDIYGTDNIIKTGGGGRGVIIQA